MNRTTAIFIFIAVLIAILLTGCSENDALLTGAAVFSEGAKQNAVDIILEISEKYKNMQDFKAVKIIKEGGDVNKEKIMIKKDKCKIEREDVIEVSDGKKIEVYKKIESNRFGESEWNKLMLSWPQPALHHSAGVT